MDEIEILPLLETKVTPIERAHTYRLLRWVDDEVQRATGITPELLRSLQTTTVRNE